MRWRDDRFSLLVAEKRAKPEKRYLGSFGFSGKDTYVDNLLGLDACSLVERICWIGEDTSRLIFQYRLSQYCQ